MPAQREEKNRESHQVRVFGRRSASRGSRSAGLWTGGAGPEDGQSDGEKKTDFGAVQRRDAECKTRKAGVRGAASGRRIHELGEGGGAQRCGAAANGSSISGPLLRWSGDAGKPQALTPRVFLYSSSAVWPNTRHLRVPTGRRRARGLASNVEQPSRGRPGGRFALPVPRAGTLLTGWRRKTVDGGMMGDFRIAIVRWQALCLNGQPGGP